MQDEPNNVSIEETDEFCPQFGETGLMPCIAVDTDSGAVLMMAWMNKAALEATLDTGIVHYWSRSRQEIWKKGETSGAFQRVDAILTDCDQDTLLVKVRADNPEQTCHTGRKSCFYRTVTMPIGSDDSKALRKLRHLD